MGRLGLITSNIQRFPCILIGCIFYGMVLKDISFAINHTEGLHEWSIAEP